jgi:Tol biopolymer transport system component
MVWRDAASLRKAPIVRTAILPPDGTTFEFLSIGGAPPMISRDGTKVVFGAQEPGKPRTLWIRSLDTLVSRQLAGTDGASFPFWSPDGRFVAFFANNALKKVEVSGGAPVVLCNINDARGGSWSVDGRTILFAGRYTPILRVSSAGGTPVAITKMEGRFTTHRWPEALPDGRHFLFLGSPSGQDDPANTVFVGRLDGKLQKPLFTASTDPHYADGYIIFVRDWILTAQPFDLKKLELTGDAFPLKEQQVEENRLSSRSMVSVAANGTLIYQTGSAIQNVQLEWLDRTGKLLGNVGDPAPYAGFSLSPDVKSVLVGTTLTRPANIWFLDLVRGVKSRVTLNDAIDSLPRWSPDGKRFVYRSEGDGRTRFILRDQSTGFEQRIYDATFPGSPGSWSSDGERLFYTVNGASSRGDLWWMSLRDRKPHPYLVTPQSEVQPRVSPDGNWIAYQADETGSMEIYLAPFPPTGAKWQVSNGGGVLAEWRGDGKELFYLVPGTKIMAVPIALGTPPQIGQAVALFDLVAGMAGPGMYSVTADGQRFLVNARIGGAPPPAPIIVVQHFDRELRAAADREE